MQLAKQHIDVGLWTDNAEAVLCFWQTKVGLPFEETLGGPEMRQHRLGMNGSVMKINEVRDGLPHQARSGYRELRIGREGLKVPVNLADVDGNAVTLVPPGLEGVRGIGVRLVVRSEAAFRRFYGEILGLDEAGHNSYRCGDSLITVAEDANVRRAGDLQGAGYRYLTIQVWDCDAEHRRLLDLGVEEGRPPFTAGNIARFSFIRDPDGNWIEISQRASLTRPLPS